MHPNVTQWRDRETNMNSKKIKEVNPFKTMENHAEFKKQEPLLVEGPPSTFC